MTTNKISGKQIPLMSYIYKTLAITLALIAVTDTNVAVGVNVPQIGIRTNMYPIAAATYSSYSTKHHDYPATDIVTRCKAVIVSPVSGIISELERANLWSKQTDNPWDRSGRFVDITGLDGVRYHLAHFNTIVDSLAVGTKVQVGQNLGTVGQTGRASGCHLHFGISPVCPNKEWWVRRGAIWPATYLAAWRKGKEKSPAVAVQTWLAKYPQACANKKAMPWPST
jgi:murein DD-endopeptidase MepM/ murein hydrolase activator NlpD